MPRRPFLVLRNQVCVPLEGAYRCEQHEGRWYVLGHHEVHAFETEAEARAHFERMRDDREANRLAQEALGELRPDFEVVGIRP